MVGNLALLLCLCPNSFFCPGTPSTRLTVVLAVEPILWRVPPAFVLASFCIDHILLLLRHLIVFSLRVNVRSETWFQSVGESGQLSHHLRKVLDRCRLAKASSRSLTWRAENLVVLYPQRLTVELWNILQRRRNKLPYILVIFLEGIAINVDMLQSLQSL